MIAILVVSVISLLAVVIDLTTLASMISWRAGGVLRVNLAVIRSYSPASTAAAPRATCCATGWCGLSAWA